jgi:ATP-dependent helicase HrpB
MRSLPIDSHLPEILEALRVHRGAVVVAPPGSGKTTRVPPAIAEAATGKVVVSQPRRVAARLAATRIADELGGRLGELVGYATRFDRRTSARTRVELVTEGLLVRRLQTDPFLEGVGCVVLDEFHERTLDVDLALALLADCRREAREDLRIVVMSATLAPGPVADFLGCPVIEAPGRTYPVDLTFSKASRARIEARCAGSVRTLLAEEPTGHVLVFLPGVGEIDRTRRALRDGDLPGDVDVLPLHGRLPLSEQAAALAPSTRRKVVLATNLAETSVTLEGARAVVDTGLARVARFDPAIGLTRLETQPISQASADQRAGRAGRTGPGRCVRLWPEADHRGRPAASEPEIRRADLAPLVLQVLEWGTDAASLRWFEPPPAGGIQRAEETLRELGALNGGALTARGQAITSLPVHPRLGAVLLAGHALGIASTAATVVALMSEMDPFRGAPDAAGDGDLEPRLAAIAEAEWRGTAPAGVDRRRWNELKKVRDQLLRRVEALDGGTAPEGPFEPLVLALLAGFPGRLGRRRDRASGRYLLASGHGAVLEERSRADSEFLFALDLGSARRGAHAEHRIRLAHPVDLDLSLVPPRNELRFDAGNESVVLRRVTRIGALVLRDDQSSERPAPGESARVLEEAARAAPDRAQGGGDAQRLLARLRFAHGRNPSVFVGAPRSWEELLPDLCRRRRSFAELRRADVAGALANRLTWPQREALDRLAPERVLVPSGMHLPVEYPDEGPPVLAARIQQMFGASETPKVGGVPLLLHLLAPNGRPAQVTQDLAGFWTGSYKEVRKDLRGRYPKHPWPDDPANAEATNRTKRRKPN